MSAVVNRLVPVSAILLLILIGGYISGVTTSDGTSGLSPETRPTAVRAIADADAHIESIQNVVTLGVRVISVSDDAGCRRLDVGNHGYRMVLEFYSLFGIGYQRAVACAGGIDTTPFR